MDKFNIISINHQSASLEEISQFYIDEERVSTALINIKNINCIEEVMFLSTCNRVEFYIYSSSELNNLNLKKIFSKVYDWTPKQLDESIKKIKLYKGISAISHMFHVGSSLNSLVIGEREILTQVKNAYEKAKNIGTIGENLKLAIQKTIVTAKEIFVNTDISNRPVSIVNLAYRILQSFQLETNSRILIVGAGATIKSLLMVLKKEGYKNFYIYNRTLTKALDLVKQFGGIARDLNHLEKHKEGFDILLTCTGANHTIIDKKLYKKLLNNENILKFVVDLALPTDFDVTIKESYQIELIELNSLKTLAEKNKEERKKALPLCNNIVKKNIKDFVEKLKQRRTELLMQDSFKSIRLIKEKTYNEIFSKKLKNVDDPTKELIIEMLSYMENKVNAVTMKNAKEILKNVEIR